MRDTLKWWVACLIPKPLAIYLIKHVDCGGFAPYVFGRIVGSRPRRVHCGAEPRKAEVYDAASGDTHEILTTEPAPISGERDDAAD